MLLMLLNNPVYNIDNETVLNKGLLPGLMAKNACNETFKKWMKLRYSSNTNTLARQLKGITFGQGNRITIDKTTRALSLSDSYWIMDEKHPILFEQISPYYAPFWNGAGQYNNESIPTLYVGGYLSKYWENPEWLIKSKDIIEVECSRLCRLCNILCAEAYEDPKGIRVRNITNPSEMLEQADMSGKFDEDNFNDDDIINIFGASGFKMVLVDAIFGNGDRHLGNFGFIRNTTTGEYLCMSPLYDFDHALDAKEPNDVLIKSVLNLVKNSSFRAEAIRILNIIILNTTNEIFRSRAKFILKKIDGK